MAYVSLHCVEAASLLEARDSKSSSTSTVGRFTNQLVIRVNIDSFQGRHKAIFYAGQATSFARSAYGKDSEEFAIFQLVEKRAQNSSSEVLLAEIQEAISSLRDIDS